MIGVMIRAGVTCPRCESLVPVGAMVQRIRCGACGETVRLGTGDWEAILGDVLAEAPRMAEGEASRSTILGEHRMTVTRGRLAPRFSGTDTAIPLELVAGVTGRTELPPPEGAKAATVVRPVPEALSDLLPDVLAIVGEDPALLASRGGGVSLEVDASSARPVAFSCPSCAGQLVTDGTRRSAVCEHCGAESEIPESLWLRIHPGLRLRGWFLALGAEAPAVGWGGDALDAAPDGSGGVALVVIEDEGPPLVMRMAVGEAPAWSKRMFEHPHSESANPRLAWSPAGWLLAWRSDHPVLHLLSPEDGSVVDVLEGADPSNASDWERFTMLGCQGLAAYDDSMVVCSGPWRDSEGRKQFRILRFSYRGDALDLWPERRRGFVSGLFSRRAGLQRFVDCGDRPVALRDAVRLGAFDDGGLLMLSRNLLARFDAEGKKLYMAELPDGYAAADPVGDASGRCWVIIQGGVHSAALVEVSPDGREVREAAFTDDSDHPLYFASALAPVREGILTAGWNGGLFVHEVAGTVG